MIWKKLFSSNTNFIVVVAPLQMNPDGKKISATEMIPD